MITVKVSVRPQIPVANGGGFPPGTFDSLFQREVDQPGLDPTWRHILIDAEITDGGDRAEWTLHSEPRLHPHNVDQSVRVFPGTPPAYVRVLSEDGAELHAGPHDSPFWIGRRIAIGEMLYEVTADEWPGRHPETGVCTGDIDWQHVRARVVEQPSYLPTPAESS